MQFDKLLKFIETEDKRLKNRYKYTDHEKRILARTVKIGEEVGELCENVLSHCSLQRGCKLNNHNHRKLAKEFADVIITTLLLAKTTGVDIEKSLKEKIKEIKTRHY